MEICRACLLTEQDMVPLDEFCVGSYNLLTNLQIKIGDNMPQFLCQNCFNMVKIFIDFREKAITSETSLQEIIQNIVTPGDLYKESENVDKIKKEIYLADDDHADSESLNDGTICTEAYGDVCCENDVDMKYQLLQCGLCKGEFVDNVSFMEHLKQHKRGGTCKFCFKKVKIVDLYDHTLKHLQPIAKLEHELDSKQTIKLEPLYNNIATSAPSKVKKKARKIKSTTKVTKKSKLSTQDAVQSFLACGLCQMLFDCKDLLIKHLVSHKTDGVSSCKVCDETFTSWPQLFGHRVTHLPQKQKHCHLCSFWCSSQYAMEFHYKKLHYDGDDKFLTCKQCFRQYATPKQLNKHISGSHKEKKYICDYCSKGFIGKNTLRIHIASHLDARPHVCDVCGFACKMKSNLMTHKLRKHDPRAMECKLCGRLFVDRDKFARHNCNPTSVVCPHCGKEFKSKRHLSRHLKSHRSEPSYTCPRCDAAYRTRGALKVHLDRHDGNRTQRCEYCPARFYSQSVLIKHRRVHTGEKPYVCKVCHKGFTGNNHRFTKQKADGPLGTWE